LVYLRYTPKRKAEGPLTLVSFTSSSVQRKGNTYSSYFSLIYSQWDLLSKFNSVLTGEGSEEPASRQLYTEEVRHT